MSKVGETVPPLDKPRPKTISHSMSEQGLTLEKCTFIRNDLPTVTRQRDQLRAALQRLVDAKDEKDANGDTPRYRGLKAGAWEEAREVLRKVKRGE